MTIGVAASGPNAGAAVRAAVLGAELLGRGAIGGFAVFAMLDENGALHHCVTQRGGITELELPETWLRARIAAAISSGPDRPEPLVQFLPGASGVGLVAGHRLPNRPGIDGTPLNRAALALLANGLPPQQAVDTVLEHAPETDAGLIAIDALGNIGWANSARVARRTDLGSHYRDEASCRLALLHNSIESQVVLSDAIADLAWSQLSGQPSGMRFLTLSSPVALQQAKHDRVHIDAHGAIVALETADPDLPSINGRGTAIYLGAEVWQGGRAIGRVATELFAHIADGVARPRDHIAQSTILMKRDTAA